MVKSSWIRLTGAVSVGLVAVVAVIVSYSHVHERRVRAGEGWRAWVEPLSVDGLLVGSSLVLLTRRTSALAWLALTTCVLVSRLVTAWPAVALALSYETLIALVRQRPPQEPDEPGGLIDQVRQLLAKARTE